MVVGAKDEHDFKEAADTLYRGYMEIRDPADPYLDVFGIIPRPEKQLIRTSINTRLCKHRIG